jgi:hypothetical protein
MVSNLKSSVNNATQQEVDEPSVSSSPPEASLTGLQQHHPSPSVHANYRQTSVVQTQALVQAMVVQPQGQVVSSASASTSSALLLGDQRGYPYGNTLPPFKHPFAASFPRPHPVESIPNHTPHTLQVHFQPTVPVDIGLLFQGVSLTNVRAAIANEKARLLGNIMMRYNGTTLSSTPSAQEQQQVSRIARLETVIVSPSYKSNNGVEEAEPSHIDQSEAIAAPIETFPEVSLASGSGKLFSNFRFLPL